MNVQERIAKLVLEAVEKKGGRMPLAAWLGVTPAALTEWVKGRSSPNARHLIQMQDLVRKAALFAAITLGTSLFFLPELASGEFYNALFLALLAPQSTHCVQMLIAVSLAALLLVFQRLPSFSPYPHQTGG